MYNFTVLTRINLKAIPEPAKITSQRFEQQEELSNQQWRSPELTEAHFQAIHEGQKVINT